ncbi:MAG: type IV secretion system protein [Candidatus Saccharimonadales bacterium]
MFDAYNIRKIAPRMLLAVIGVNISIYLCVAAVDITNVIGGGLGALIREPFEATGSFGEQEISFGDTGSDIGGSIVGAAGGGLLVTLLAVLGGGSLGLILWLLLLLMLAAGLIALAIMATVVIRFGAIILLTLVSPVAIALLVLPGTEKYFRRWWEYFIKTLAVYPIIAAIFAISDAMGAIFLKVQNDTNALNEAVIVIVLIVVVYAPLFMIPFSFKLAGGFLGSIYDLANKNMYGRAKPHLDEFRKNSKTMKDAREKAKTHYDEKGGNLPGIGKGIQSMTRARKSRLADYKKRKENEEWLRDYQDRYNNGTTTMADREKAKKLAAEGYADIDKRDEVSAIKKQGLQSRRSHFKEAYKAGYASELGENFKNKDAEELKKRWGHIEGYDDLFKVAQDHYGSSHAEIMQAMSAIDPSKYGSGTATGSANATQAASQIMDMQNKMGSEERMRRAGTIGMSTAKTAFKDHAEMIDYVDKAAGDDSTLRSMILAEVQKNQDQAGRKDVGGGGFTETSISLEKYARKRRELESDKSLTDAQRKSMLVDFGQELTHGVTNKETGEVLQKGYLDVVSQKNSDVALGQAHERSFAATSQHLAKRMNEAVTKAKSDGENPVTSAAIQEFTARLENLGESSAYFSGKNREIVSTMLQGEEGDPLTSSGKPGQPIQASKIKVRQRAEGPADSSGNYPTVEVEYTPRQLAELYKRSTSKYPTYHTNKREFGSADDEGRNRFGGGAGPHG